MQPTDFSILERNVTRIKPAGVYSQVRMWFPKPLLVFPAAEEDVKRHWRFRCLNINVHMKTVFLVPYLRGESTNKCVAQFFSRNLRGIKSVTSESIDLGLSKKSNESF